MIASPQDRDGGTIDCTTAQLALQDRFDGEPATIPAIDARRVDAHADGCRECLAFRLELERTRRGLEALPGLEFPAPALHEVWARTVETTVRTDPADLTMWSRPRRRRPLGVAAALAAAAALLITSAGAFFFSAGGRVDRGAMSETELARLDRDVHRALMIVRDVLSGAEHVAVDHVLAGEAAQVIRVIAPVANDDGRATP